jgi:transposase InsO family protein
VVKKQDWKKVGEIVAKVRELGLSYKEGAKRFGVKPWLLYDHNRKSNHATGKSSVSPRAEPAKEETSKDATSGAATLPGDVGELIRNYRQTHPDHGFKRIQDLLKQKHLVIVTRKQIRKVLKDAGLLESCDSSFDREPDRAKGTRRFEAAYPREMWQMDLTYVYICGIPVLYLVVIIDDHSRYCIAADLVRDQRADTLIGVLHNAVTVYGAPRKLLTDQGSGFYSWSREQTRFQEYLDDSRIEHVVAEPHSPQSQGKVERFIQSIRDELLTRVKFTGFEDAQAQIRSYVCSYNVDRPHQGIGGSRPADRFHGVAGEVERVQAQLAGRELDPERSYVIYKVGEHRVCVSCRAEGVMVYLDGKLLKEADGDRCNC